MLLAKEGKEKSLRVLGYWRTLINGWQATGSKNKKLRINAKWRVLAVKVLQKDKKLTHLRATGNWLKMYLALKRYEYEIYRERRSRKLVISSQWTRMARKMLQRHNKTAHLRAIGRWRVLYLGLKTMDFGDQKDRKKRRLVATTAWGRLSRKLLQQENKKQSLRVIGRWRKLYLGLKTVDLQELKAMK